MDGSRFGWLSSVAVSFTLGAAGLRWALLVLISCAVLHVSVAARDRRRTAKGKSKGAEILSGYCSVPLMKSKQEQKPGPAEEEEAGDKPHQEQDVQPQAVFINHILAQLWPALKPQMEQMLTDVWDESDTTFSLPSHNLSQVSRMLSLPSRALAKAHTHDWLHLQHLDLGRLPPLVTDVRVSDDDCEPGEMVLDADVRLVSDHALLKLSTEKEHATPFLQAMVEHFRCVATLRVVLTPVRSRVAAPVLTDRDLSCSRTTIRSSLSRLSLSRHSGNHLCPPSPCPSHSHSHSRRGSTSMSTPSLYSSTRQSIRRHSLSSSLSPVSLSTTNSNSSHHVPPPAGHDECAPTPRPSTPPPPESTPSPFFAWAAPAPVPGVTDYENYGVSVSLLQPPDVHFSMSVSSPLVEHIMRLTRSFFSSTTGGDGEDAGEGPMEMWQFNLMNMPVVSDWLHRFITARVTDRVLFPNMLRFPLSRFLPSLSLTQATQCSFVPLHLRHDHSTSSWRVPHHLSSPSPDCPYNPTTAQQQHRQQQQQQQQRGRRTRRRSSRLPRTAVMEVDELDDAGARGAHRHSRVEYRRFRRPSVRRSGYCDHCGMFPDDGPVADSDEDSDSDPREFLDASRFGVQGPNPFRRSHLLRGRRGRGRQPPQPPQHSTRHTDKKSASMASLRASLVEMLEEAHRKRDGDDTWHLPEAARHLTEMHRGAREGETNMEWIEEFKDMQSSSQGSGLEERVKEGIRRKRLKQMQALSSSESSLPAPHQPIRASSASVHARPSATHRMGDAVSQGVVQDDSDGLPSVKGWRTQRWETWSRQRGRVSSPSAHLRRQRSLSVSNVLSSPSHAKVAEPTPTPDVKPVYHINPFMRPNVKKR